MKNLRLIFFFLTVCFAAYSQTQSPFIFPLKGKIVLNGNYGEVRPNHFHAGIDFRTHYVNHLPIYAVADGYVSRIKISTTGYGKVLYVTHPNGLVSVYGHEYAFADKIKQYVENAQEIAEVFEIELFPKPTELPVKQGDVIGYTGNTGSSEGPHLHFEIRDEKTEVPYNPLRFLKIDDVVAPKIKRVALYSKAYGTPIIEKLISIPPKNDTIVVDYEMALGIECFDYEQIGGNKNNIYKAEIYVDDKLFYQHVLDSIPFDLARYVNAYADYEMKKDKGIIIQKLWKEKNNDLPLYKLINDDGFISLKDNNFHKIKIVVYDFYNQKDEIKFCVKLVKGVGYARIKPKQNCLEKYIMQAEDFSIELPAKSAYRDFDVLTHYEGTSLNFKAFSYDIPFQNNCVIKLRTPQNLTKYGNKLCIADVTKGTKTYVEGIFENGFVKANIKTFGKYKVDADTIAPQITLLSQKKTSYKTGNIVSFKVSDSYSGIGVFKLHLNGKWHLAEYERKTNTIFFAIDEKVTKGSVILNLQVSDKKNNQANFQTTLLVE